ncbi:IclR family transcriptional regulator [Arundinibacter roseus]|uniref:IclR family transcriptional regulator n=1 Tax=Arundinibacter roseus TaxID=2070510 RepID=A0A4R4KH59_9BACT|nr:IclR family transcriptional regulator C-terminal domain-containing protein [Arundinibacter roseus]TDB67404.1 IclR family transcriptional regulator [Arundinibacter roseus]
MIQVIHRALDLMELIAMDPQKPKPLGELADSLGLNHGTCANILKTLVTRGYIEQLGAKKGYILGSKSYVLTGNDAYHKDLMEASQQAMDELTRLTNENCLLAILKDSQRLIVYRTFAEQDLQVRTSEEKPAYESASGRMLLAMLPAETIERFILKFGLPTDNAWPEVHSKEELFAALSLIQREEFALQTISNRHIVGIAVPIRRKGIVAASLSIYLPEYRYMATDKTQLVNNLRKAAQAINTNLN